MAEVAYRHAEWNWPIALLAPLGGAVGALILWVVEGPHGWPPILVLLAVNAALVLALSRLTIELDARELRWHFGLLGWPSWRVALDEVLAAEPAASRWTEGSGIRKTADGMLYKALASSAVRLQLRDGRRIRLGTPEPRRLIAFLEPRLREHGRR